MQPPPELPDEKRQAVKIRTFFDQRGDAQLQFILGDRWAYLPLSSLVAGIGAQLATATPPQEYDLPLAAGVIAEDGCTYRKNQFGQVSVSLGVKGTFTDGMVVGTLPAGYRPAKRTRSALGAARDAEKFGGWALVQTDGQVVVFIDKQATFCFSNISFIAV